MKVYNKCLVPFTQIEIHPNGDVFFCCPIIISKSIGNVYKQPFDEIWYSDIAKEIRREILHNNCYKYCDMQICNPIDNINMDILDIIDDLDIEESEAPPYPQYVKFCHERHCNIKCVTCRDDYCLSSKQETQELDSKIEPVFLPILKNCKVVSLNGAGEVFASKHCCNLIKSIVRVYPNIKFDIHTNGVLCDKKLCDELQITDRLISVDVSMHAVTKDTYQKIHLGSNFDKVNENLNWLKTLKYNGNLKKLNLYFVVQRYNYKEMKLYIQNAKKIGANVYFWEYRNWGNEWGNENYENVAIYEKWHPEYNEFAQILQDDIFKEKHCFLNKYLKSCIPISDTEHKLEINNHKINKKIQEIEKSLSVSSVGINTQILDLKKIISTNYEEINNKIFELENKLNKIDEIFLFFNRGEIYRKYYRYKFFSKILYGKKRKHYKEKAKFFHEKVRKIRHLKKGKYFI